MTGREALLADTYENVWPALTSLKYHTGEESSIIFDSFFFLLCVCGVVR